MSSKEHSIFINCTCLPRRGDCLWQLPNARNAYILLCVSQLLLIFLSKWAFYEGSSIGPHLETPEVGVINRKCNNCRELLTRQRRVDSGRKFCFRELICNYCKICFKKQLHIFLTEETTTVKKYCFLWCRSNFKCYVSVMEIICIMAKISIWVCPITESRSSLEITSPESLPETSPFGIFSKCNPEHRVRTLPWLLITCLVISPFT